MVLVLDRYTNTVFSQCGVYVATDCERHRLLRLPNADKTTMHLKLLTALQLIGALRGRGFHKKNMEYIVVCSMAADSSYNTISINFYTYFFMSDFDRRIQHVLPDTS